MMAKAEKSPKNELEKNANINMMDVRKIEGERENKKDIEREKGGRWVKERWVKNDSIQCLVNYTHETLHIYGLYKAA